MLNDGLGSNKQLTELFGKIIFFQAPLDTFSLAFCALYVVGNSLQLLFLCRVGDLIIIEVRENTIRII